MIYYSISVMQGRAEVWWCQGKRLDSMRPYQILVHGRRKDFFRGGRQQWIFSGSSQIHFPGLTVMKFHFTNSRLREKHFSTKRLIGKYLISKNRKEPRISALPSNARGLALKNVKNTSRK